MSSAPLEGIRVIEAAHWVAAPGACALMADLGAEVVKVEPPGGDPFRRFRLRPEADPGPVSPPFEADNRGKRSIVIDLHHPDGPPLLRALAAAADVFVTNLLPGRLERYGLTAERLQARPPGPVYVAVSGYGARGPDRERPAFDDTAFWAHSGIQGLMGEPGRPPLMQRPGMGDHAASLSILAGALAALRRREQTGRSTTVDASLFAAGSWMLSSDLSCALLAHRQPPRYSRRQPFNPIWNAYRTADGQWVLLVMPQPDVYWPRMCRALERPEWIEDARYRTRADRMARAGELVEAIDAILAGAPLAVWRERFQAERLIWSPVLELPQLAEDPQVAAMGYLREVPHPEAGGVRLPAAPFTFHDADVRPRGPAPAPGADTEAVLREAGHAPEAIARLREAGVVR